MATKRYQKKSGINPDEYLEPMDEDNVKKYEDPGVVCKKACDQAHEPAGEMRAADFIGQGRYLSKGDLAGLIDDFIQYGPYLEPDLYGVLGDAALLLRGGSLKKEPVQNKAGTQFEAPINGVAFGVGPTADAAVHQLNGDVQKIFTPEMLSLYAVSFSDLVVEQHPSGFLGLGRTFLAKVKWRKSPKYA
jgi:hypothetical protein